MKKLSTVLLAMTSLLTPSTANAMKPKVPLDTNSLAIVSKYLPTKREAYLNFESVSKKAQMAIRNYGYSDVWYDLCIKNNRKTCINYEPLGASLKKEKGLQFISTYIESIRSCIEIIPLKSRLSHSMLAEFRELSRCFVHYNGRFYFVYPRKLRVSSGYGEVKGKEERITLRKHVRRRLNFMRWDMLRKI